MTGSSRTYDAAPTVADGEEVHCGHPAGELLVDAESREECPTYTPVEVYDVLRLRIAGWECGEIALETGLSSREVAALVRTYTDGLVAVRAGLKKRNHHGGAHGGARPAAGRPREMTEAESTVVRELKSAGLPYQAIADVMGCNERRVKYIAKAGRPCGLTDEQRARILQLHSEGLRYVEIATVVGCTQGQARYIAERGR